MIGRRRPDMPFGEYPEDVQRGDYWKVLSREGGEPLESDCPDNLTGTVWEMAAPIGEKGFAVGHLSKHTVREHEDGTVSVRPGDGSSNSILVDGGTRGSYHGYIERGVWT